ncbi:MAG: hypothetical protein Q7T97_06025 [Burkholderiaceae bacterium]|nr:hypothetical protein [Burkholderiaceae bacterium]
MSLQLPSLRRLALVIFVAAPVAAWIIVKPIRVVFPTVQGMSCVSASVCVEDPDEAQAAVALYEEAFDFVSATVVPLRKKPRLIFCSTEICANKFGLGARAALTVGKFGTVVGPRAWTPYLVRHEMIHSVQCEQLGVLKVLRMPSWFVEGMAYSLSEDPRDQLPPPLEGYRSAFDSWFETIDRRLVWHEAKRL